MGTRVTGEEYVLRLPEGSKTRARAVLRDDECLAEMFRAAVLAEIARREGEGEG